MFSQDTLEKIPEPLAKIFKELENDVIKDILKRMSNIDEIIPASDYQLWRLSQLGSHKAYVKKRIQEALKLSDKEINRIYNETIASGYARDEEIYKEVGADFIPLEENEPLKQLIGAIKEQTNGDLKNITGSLGYVVNSEGVSESTYFNNVLNRAEVELMTGTGGLNSILKQTVNELVNSGVRYIDYASGRRDRVDVAVRRAVMTGVHQVTGKISQDNAEALGTDKYEVSAHATARPTHQVWQGRVYTYQELIDICGLGTATGLCGINCYHHYDPFIEGISVRKYTDAELDKMNEEANKVKSYQGKDYTKYEATQEQRRIERQLRGINEKITYLKQYGGSKDDISTLKSKYTAYINRYEDFSKQMGLPFQPERIHTSNDAKLAMPKNNDIIEKMPKQKGNLLDNTFDFMKDKNPGVGNVSYDTDKETFRKSDDAWEMDEDIAQRLLKFVGDNVVLRTPLKLKNKKDPDSYWIDGKLWEFKTPTKIKAFESAMHSAVKQIQEKSAGEPGGIVFDLKDLRANKIEINEDMIKDLILYRANRSLNQSIDIILLDIDKIYKVYKYVK